MPRLYAILDDDTVAAHEDWPGRLARLLEVAREQLWVQVRLKRAERRVVRAVAAQACVLCEPYRAVVLINDRLDLVWELEDEGRRHLGVHLTEASMPVAAARALAPHVAIAASRHDPNAARRAAQDGADLVVLGPIFDTPSKRGYGAPLGPQALASAASHWPATTALAAIGGIASARHIDQVRTAGASCIAAISACWRDDGAAFAAASLANTPAVG